MVFLTDGPHDKSEQRFYDGTEVRFHGNVGGSLSADTMRRFHLRGSSRLCR